MKNKIIKTTLLASSLAILLWGGITLTPPQGELKPSMPILTENETPDDGGISPLSNFSPSDSDEDDIPLD